MFEATRISAKAAKTMKEAGQPVFRNDVTTYQFTYPDFSPSTTPVTLTHAEHDITLSISDSNTGTGPILKGQKMYPRP